MFGYVKPCKPEMRVKEYDAYRAVYCGLCRQMGKSYGPFARLALSYDFTFLCALAYSLSGEAPAVEMGRCCVNPLKRVPMCREDGVLSMGADTAVIMIYYKLLDNIQDEGLLSRMGWSLLRPVAGAARRRAAAARPEVDRILARMMAEQGRLEEEGCGVDQACEPTAGALAELFAGLAEDGTQKRVLERMGYLLGRYVYLSDAYDDMEKDAGRGSFNPYLRAGRSEGEAMASLLMTAGEVGKAYGLLEPGDFRPVLDNIVYLGLAAGVQEIHSKKEKCR